MKIAAVGDPFTVEALRLMGITGAAVESEDEAAAALDGALEPDTVVLITKAAADMIRPKVDKCKVARQKYIVMEIPSLEGAPRQAEEVARLVSQAIGVKL